MVQFLHDNASVAAVVLSFAALILVLLYRAKTEESLKENMLLPLRDRQWHPVQQLLDRCMRPEKTARRTLERLFQDRLFEATPMEIDSTELPVTSENIRKYGFRPLEYPSSLKYYNVRISDRGLGYLKARGYVF